jgi:hypothetical protein
MPDLVMPNVTHTEPCAAAPSEAKQPSTSCFITFEDKQVSMFVNACHIVRFEHHQKSGKAMLQLSDGHHYYLSEAASLGVIDQLRQFQ